jgi:hypothetical protein
MDPWFTEGTADSKREASENVALGIRGTPGIVNSQRYIDAVDAAIATLPDPAKGEAVSIRAQMKSSLDGQPVQLFHIEVAIFRKGTP